MNPKLGSAVVYHGGTDGDLVDAPAIVTAVVCVDHNIEVVLAVCHPSGIIYASSVMEGRKAGQWSWPEVASAPDGDPKPKMPTIVCLCGSGRFREAFEEAEFRETLAGRIVLTIGCNIHDVARSANLAHHKPMLDELHLRKIDLADEVLILNVGGYIGSSTRKELEYAIKTGKPVQYLEPVQEAGK